MKIAKITPCRFSLHSYLNPLGLGLLPQTHTLAEKLGDETGEASLPIRNMVERKNVSFFCQASKHAYVAPGEPGWFRREWLVI